MKSINKKINIYKLLGAEYFQKIVFIVEKIKYITIDKFFPNIEKWYFKQCDKKRDKKLTYCKDEIEKRNIIEYYRLEKLKFKKELNKKENRNYHIDYNKPEEFKKYLEYNKKIHIEGLIGNGIISTVVIIVNILLSNPLPIIFYLILVYEIISAIINFECVNLQNYNICRLEDAKNKKILEKIKEKKEVSFSKKMSKGSKVIGNTFREKEDIPTIYDIIDNITTKEEVEELLNYLKKYIENKEKDNKLLERKKNL